MAIRGAADEVGGGDRVFFRLASSPVPVKTAGSELEEVVLSSKLKERDGFVYLDVPDEIIDGFIAMIPKRGLERPEAGSDKAYVGAHISVMYDDEYAAIKKKRRKLVELGQAFDYTLTGMHSTTPEGWEGVKEVFFLTVKSPQLEALRKKYGLSKKLNGHDYHVTVAIRR